jgi:S-DNA-T family DNA segregation ATPase FtsK/SpoIIIE
MWSFFQKEATEPDDMAATLPVVIGKDGRGQDIELDLSELPHLLIAGMVKSGKSVLIHNILSALIAQHGPDRLRLILFDARHIELDVYNGLPHLLTPVITDARKAVKALNWLVKEIERRYLILKAESVGSIEEYHVKLNKVLSEETEEIQMEAMPYILVVLDELSDAMRAYSREIEPSITRVAQMGSKVGIHLLLSTSNMSPKVLTSNIKMNIPARIVFQVTSEVESRSALGTIGAEKIRGVGEALYLTRDMTKPARLSVHDLHIKTLRGRIKAVKDAYPIEEQPVEPLEPAPYWAEDSVFGSYDPDEVSDDLFESAAKAARESGKASTSYLQRKLGIGYARAAKLIDLLEERGVIGPADGSKPRLVIERTDK